MHHLPVLVSSVNEIDGTWSLVTGFSHLASWPVGTDDVFCYFSDGILKVFLPRTPGKAGAKEHAWLLCVWADGGQDLGAELHTAGSGGQPVPFFLDGVFICSANASLSLPLVPEVPS